MANLGAELGLGCGGFDMLVTYRFFTLHEFRVKGEMGEPGDSPKIVATSSWSYSEKQPSVTSGSEQVSCRGEPSRESLDWVLGAHGLLLPVP